MTDKNTKDKNKTPLILGGCCLLIIVIAIIAYGTGEPQNTLQENQTLVMYGVNLTVPGDVNTTITNTTYPGGMTYALEDTSKDLTIYVTDDPSPEVNYTPTYSSDLGWYQKTDVNGKTVIVYSSSSDLTEQILLSAH